MTEHVDFELDWAGGADIGWKLVAINVSDIAAMGGRPTRAVVTIQLGEATTIDLIDEIAVGIAEGAQRWGVKVVGGDIGRGSELGLTCTLLGDVDGPPVLRSGARPGDFVCITGAIGGAVVGLVALQTGVVQRDNVRAEIARPSGADGLAVLAARQLRPQPRLHEGLALRSLATAMIDISDGFASDLERLCTASNVGCEVDGGTIPLDPELDHGLAKIGAPPEPLEWALTGGEDFELLFCLPSARAVDKAQHRLDELGTSVSVVGKITAEGRSLDGRPLEEWSKHGWDHLRTR